jgi:hypothetical protein
LADSSFKYVPLQYLRETFVAFIQGLFAAAPPNSFHWTSDLEHTEIMILDENPINAEKIGARPAINIVRGPLRFAGVGLDDMADYQFDTGKKTKEVFITGTISVNCLSSNDLESEQIAWIVGEMVWLLRERLLQEGLFETGREINLGSPSPAGSLVMNDQGSEWYATTLTIPYQFIRRSAFTPLGMAIMKSIDLHMSTRRQSVISKGTPDAGYNVTTVMPDHFSSASDAGGKTPDPAGVNTSYLPKMPVPGNPSAGVVIQRPYNSRPGIRPASIGGGPIPIKIPCVEESK